MPSADAWRRRYERAEQARLQLLEQLRQAVHTGADDLQKQVDALELLVLKRAALVSIEQDGPKLNLTFTRRGERHVLTVYSGMSTDVAALRKVLLDD